MPTYASSSAARSDEIAGTLRLLLFLGMAVALMVLDSRGNWLHAIRAQGEVLVQPLWQLAGLPAKLGESVRDDAATRSRLSVENRNLRNALLINQARLTRLQAAAAENARLRGLLGVAELGGLDVQLAPILDIALDPVRQRLVLDVGARDGVSVGQAVIDAGGLLGQVIEVRSTTATVLLLTDPDHAVPVAVQRSGIRLIAYGRGDRLELANVPLSGDVKVGDVVVTSGLGGRFPPGFPVGTIIKLQPNESRAFLVGELKPAAQLDRGRDVLLLRRVLRPIATANNAVKLNEAANPNAAVNPDAAANGTANAPNVQAVVNPPAAPKPAVSTVTGGLPAATNTPPTNTPATARTPPSSNTPRVNAPPPRVPVR